MNPHPPSPCQSLKEKRAVAYSPKTLPPPITPARLVIGLLLITVAWSGTWLKVREDMGFAILLTIMCFALVPWAVDPSPGKQMPPIKPKELLWVVPAIIGAMAILIFTKGTKPRLWLDHAIIQPPALVLFWLLNCGLLALAWWKRRNNLPYQPETHIDAGTAGSESEQW